MRRRIRIYCLYYINMSYEQEEEEDTCHMRRRRIHVI
jgi:hypothetical protein